MTKNNKPAPHGRSLDRLVSIFMKHFQNERSAGFDSLWSTPGDILALGVMVARSHSAFFANAKDQRRPEEGSQ